MSKNKLWVYGCSFSQPFWDERIEKHGVPRYKVEQGWPYILSEKLNLELVDRSHEGSGWNVIAYSLEKDLLESKISKDDMVIISPSYFIRTSFPEMITGETTEDEILRFISRHSIPLDSIALMNVERFTSKILTLKNLGYKVYGWTWDSPSLNRSPYFDNPYLLKVKENLIPAPDGTYVWEDYVLSNTECMSIPGELKWNEEDDGGDSHFSIKGHKITAEQMYNSIQKTK